MSKTQCNSTELEEKAGLEAVIEWKVGPGGLASQFGCTGCIESLKLKGRVSGMATLELLIILLQLQNGEGDRFCFRDSRTWCLGVRCEKQVRHRRRLGVSNCEVNATEEMMVTAQCNSDR